MHIEALLAMLKQLKLYGMRQSVQDLSLALLLKSGNYSAVQ